MNNQTNEQYIIELIREGKANKEIAEALRISLPALKSRIHRLLKAYNCKNRVQLALADRKVSRESI